MNQIFIPPIVQIIEDYMAPDYRCIFDSVIKDLNWIVSDYAGAVQQCLLLNNDTYIEELYTDKEWIAMFPLCYNEEYDNVMKELSEKFKIKHEECHSRFWTNMNYEYWMMCKEE